MNKSKLPISWLSHLILRTKTLNPNPPNLNNNNFRFLHNSSNPLKFNRIFPKPRNYSAYRGQRAGLLTEDDEKRALFDLDGAVQREELKEREAKRKAGIVVDEAVEEEEDYLGLGPLIDKIDAEVNKPYSRVDRMRDLSVFDKDTDDDSEDDEVYDPLLAEQERKGALMFDKIVQRHRDLVASFSKSSSVEEAYNLMMRINRFEEKHFRLRPEYRVLGDLMNIFKDATGKEKFVLAQKLNRGFRLVENREKFDPNDSANYARLPKEDDGDEIGLRDDDDDAEKPMVDGDGDGELEEEFDDMKGRDNTLVAKVNEIDKQLEEKLAALEYTFGKKGKDLEREISALAEERNALTDKKKIAMYRKGFEVKLVNLNRTVKVTKGGQIAKYTAMVACGNYNGVLGYAKAKGPKVPQAIQKAHEKCFQNLHYIERYQEHTIAHAVQTKFKKTKVYMWPMRTEKALVAGKTAEIILQLAGFTDIRCKVIGSKNPHNIVMAILQGLNAVETPKDIQEKFGRTVVETVLLK